MGVFAAQNPPKTAVLRLFWGRQGCRWGCLAGRENSVDIVRKILRSVAHEVGVDLDRDGRIRVTGEVLHTLERHAAEDETCDVSVPQNVRRHREINGHNGVVVSDLIAEALDLLDGYHLAGDRILSFPLHDACAACLYSVPGVCE